VLALVRSARLALPLAVASVLAARSVEAKQVPVASVVDLENAVAAAMPGDEIILSPGPYTVSTIDCTANGTMSQPIVVRGAMPLTSQVKGSSAEAFHVSGAYWTFEDLDVEGGCGQDSTCGTAFHVVGAADGFTLTGSRVRDFDRSIAVDAAQVSGLWRAPDGGLLFGNEIADTHARDTTNPVIKVDLAAGSGWVVRANYIHDFRRVDGVRAYGAVMRGGGSGDVFDRNLVLCTHDWTATNGTLAVGLSVGGDGTPPASCAPAYDADAACTVEQTGGIVRNDIIVACSDVGVWVSRGAAVHVLFDTVIDTPGVDFDQATTTGEAHGNVLTNIVRQLDGAVIDTTGNLDSVTPNEFLLMYAAPLDGDLRAASAGSLDMLIGKAPTVASVTDDYCARPRTAPYDLGALQASLGDCITVPPPLTAADGGATDAGDDGGGEGGQGGDASTTRDASLGDAGDGGVADGGKSGGCACTSTVADAPAGGAAAIAAMLALALGRRRRPCVA
jgi:MYXO-CTERM domain-containing protein